VEPFRMLAQPRMVWRALDREVECDLDPDFPRPRDEAVEVLERPELRVDSLVPALVAADRPRAAGIYRSRGERVVAALPVRRPDRMDRREVDDVESELRELREHPLDTAEAAPRAREELVPRAEPRELAVGVDLERLRQLRHL